ncbi:sporulation integral membrane protein YtvI [Vulcanibacillus modesticaldus]|uniref:Sporulation integral membrane protein YtvI n=1 Tax=Vulcanibacillus modesticaldus TaxID=337097 RepID=A0A1D2YU72_9BACI|nr:sporulation integral membrane protein YtvI [Vulcanibacillus modesticaldus]OEF99237.1 sporulation integral membrane protein YtvI [Vulcanibacillus modesticaldus]
MNNYAKKVLVATLIVLGTIVIPIGLYYILPHFLPFLLAYLVSLMLEPINQLLINKGKLKRIIAVNITYFLFLGVFLLLIYFTITKITTEMFNLIGFFQENIPNIQSWILNFYQQFQDFIQLLPKEIADQINQSIKGFIQILTSLDLISSIGSHTYNLTTAIPNYFIITILVFISLYLFSLNLHKINSQFYKYFKDSSREKVNIVLSEVKLATVGFIQAQFILSTITYIISLIGLAILDIRYSLAIALFIVIVDILPILGTGSVLMPWAIFSLTRGKMFLGVGLIILFFVITISRKIIEPRILGERIGLGPLTTLISIWVGFKVFGILGVFFAPLLIILFNALVKADVIRYNIKI